MGNKRNIKKIICEKIHVISIESYYSGQMEKDEIGGTCIRNKGAKKRVQNFIRESQREETTTKFKIQ